MQQLIQITDIHGEDAFSLQAIVGGIFCITEDTIVEPSNKEGFTFFRELEPVNSVIEIAIVCFYAVKYKKLNF